MGTPPCLVRHSDQREATFVSLFAFLDNETLLKGGQLLKETSSPWEFTKKGGKT